MTQLAKDSRLISKYLVSVHDGSALACTPVFALAKRIETDLFYQQIDRSRLMQTVAAYSFVLRASATLIGHTRTGRAVINFFGIFHTIFLD